MKSMLFLLVYGFCDKKIIWLDIYIMISTFKRLHQNCHKFFCGLNKTSLCSEVKKHRYSGLHVRTTSKTSVTPKNCKSNLSKSGWLPLWSVEEDRQPQRQLIPSKPEGLGQSPKVPHSTLVVEAVRTAKSFWNLFFRAKIQDEPPASSSLLVKLPLASWQLVCAD